LFAWSKDDTYYPGGHGQWFYINHANTWQTMPPPYQNMQPTPEPDAVERAAELLIEACHYLNVEPPPGHMLRAPFTEASEPWMVAIHAITTAILAATGRG
jgi:hypothetical protein